VAGDPLFTLSSLNARTFHLRGQLYCCCPYGSVHLPLFHHEPETASRQSVRQTSDAWDGSDNRWGISYSLTSIGEWVYLTGRDN